MKLVRDRLLPLALISVMAVPGLAQQSGDGVEGEVSELVRELREYRQSHEREILTELIELAQIPNHATDLDNILRNAEVLESMLERRGLTHRRLELEPAAGGPALPPAILGELRVPGAERTVVFYAHYDGQPVDESQWASAPFEPLLRSAALESGGTDLDFDSLQPPYDPEWRLYARAISDDRAPIVALLQALDALRAAGREPSVNLKFFFEGEEEFGSPNLERMLRRHQQLLSGDLWVFCDGPVHPSRRQQVVFGVRGVMGLQITSYGPAGPLHSGHYGNWAPNPAAVLTHVVAGLRDLDGRIKVEGFYDDVRALTAADREALASVPSVDDDLRYQFALASTEAFGAPLSERILLPALNVDGLSAAQVGESARNAVPSEARAAIDFRLVPDQTPERIRRLVEDHLRQAGYTVVHEPPSLELRRETPRILFLEWEQGYRSLRTPVDSIESRAVLQVVDQILGQPVIRMPILGGSLPLYLFEEVLKTPLIVLPTVNHDNNQHAPNENLRLQNLWDAIELFGGLMVELGPAWQQLAR
jgi:acetylornithine deacetylase/succinyl-diaminopimelate desuccinylase-like protein